MESKIIKFTKMHGAGNDYIYINDKESLPSDLSELAVKMSNRHTGVGGDGIILILPSEVADFKMRMFNADGSEGEMCGNASRCIAKYVYDKKLTTKKAITLETLSGIKVLHLHLAHDEVVSVTVDMGEPIFESEKIPVSAPVDVVNFPIQTSAGNFLITAVSMGNPHGVIFTEGVKAKDITKIGPELECHSIFPKKANIEFVEMLSPNHLIMRVWERGSGETLACGTGACATVVAGVTLGKCERECTISLLGGDLKIKWDEFNNHVYMTGGAVIVFEGEYIYNS